MLWGRVGAGGLGLGVSWRLGLGAFTIVVWVQSLDQEDPLEEEMATLSSILAWRIP